MIIHYYSILNISNYYTPAIGNDHTKQLLLRERKCSGGRSESEGREEGGIVPRNKQHPHSATLLPGNILLSNLQLTL